MLGDFLARFLLMIFGYAYPAFQCYKAVVKSPIQVQELRYWCQFWIIVAILTIVERIADAFVGWFPMYGELKLALFIYLWYPKTMGSGYVFDTLLRPLVDKNDKDIEKMLKDLRVKAWDLAIFYWNNCTELSQSALLRVVNYIASQRQSIPSTPIPPSKKHK
ncbi:HVA22-like protein i [Benincasa hispida]|uniref:HVA22-like protein i n=1 Tax=Benincasa hispida TaxID=102211 RepID=UPI001900826D|nr:HVA22-like protein i [Benincasa hispida]